MATKRQRTLAAGFARRMALVAKFGREMASIRETYEREFGEPIDKQVKLVYTAMCLRELGVAGPVVPEEGSHADGDI